MSTKKIRKTHTAEFEAEALKLADKIGVAATARELKLHESQLRLPTKVSISCFMYNLLQLAGFRAV